MLDTESRISIPVSIGTLTEHSNALHHAETLVTIPLMYYITLNSVYYEKLYRSVHTCGTSYTNVKCQTDPISSTVVTTETFDEINLASPSPSPVDSDIEDKNV
ncbi:unnamed protein product [Rotaria sp. Silwood1]|nr:unnamed protein product [Rotaria sp. Silwood1]